MKFEVDKSLDAKILRAASIASEFFKSGLHPILDKESFDYTYDTPVKVFNRISTLNGGMSAKVLPWKPWNIWTKAIATTYPSKPGCIYINVRKVGSREIADYVNTLVHETLHLAPISYSHGDNNPVGKSNSVNYWVGALASMYARSRIPLG